MTSSQKFTSTKKQRESAVKFAQIPKGRVMGTKTLSSKLRAIGRNAAETRKKTVPKKKAPITKGLKVTSDASPKVIAEWMTAQIQKRNRLLQVDAVAAIKKMFGKKFVYVSDIGEMSIDRRVLYQFNKLTEDDVVWVTRQGGGFSEDAHWRLRGPGDSPQRTQYEY